MLAVSGRPHIRIASGAEVITRFISEYVTTPHTTATRNRGCRAISRSGRPRATSAGAGRGSSTPDSTAIASTATAACAR